MPNTRQNTRSSRTSDPSITDSAQPKSPGIIPAQTGPETETPGNIAKAIIDAFSDETFMKNRLIPLLAAAFHDGIMMEIEKRDKKIHDLESELRMCKASLEEQEQYSRRNTLLLHGIPERPQENTDKLLCDFAKEKLEIEISPMDLDRTHRVGSFTSRDGSTRIRPVIAKFSRYGPRQAVYAARAKLKGSKIYIHENLTTERQIWMQKIRKKYPTPHNRVWSQDGRIKIRTETDRILTVSSARDMRTLQIND